MHHHSTMTHASTSTHAQFCNNLQVKQLFEFIFNTDCGTTAWQLHKFCWISVERAWLRCGFRTEVQKPTALCTGARSSAASVPKCAAIMLRSDRRSSANREVTSVEPHREDVGNLSLHRCKRLHCSDWL